MKTIVLSAIIAMTSIVNSLAANNGLVYNTQMEGNRMTTRLKATTAHTTP